MLLFFTMAICQENDEKKYNSHYDTLIVINNLLIDSDKVMVTREQILEADTILVNQKGLNVVSFKFNALSLGNNITLQSDGCRITEEMKNLIVKNKDVSYKFFYIKDIVLYSGSNRQSEPSTKTVKVVFSN